MKSNVVVVDMLDKDWAMALRSSSDVLVVGYMHIESMHWLLSVSRRSDS